MNPDEVFMSDAETLVREGRCLSHDAKGADHPMPLVLLHGFGGARAVWNDIVSALPVDRRTIAFDLPGFAESLDWPDAGHVGKAARAVETSLDHLGVDKVHLAGHSMGGATAVLFALNNPGRVRSLTLLAPGGFGSEINHRLLNRYAEASSREELEVLLEQFFGWQAPLPDGLVDTYWALRQKPGMRESLIRIAGAILDGDKQGVLPRDRLPWLGCPVKVLWGTQDRVVPTRQAHRLDGLVSTHIFEQVGHMLPEEIPAEAARLIAENIVAGDAIAYPLDAPGS